MDRRHFCKIGALALGAIGAGGINVRAGVVAGGPDVRVACRCRVTVIRTECYDDIQSLYLDDPESGPCGCFKAGDVFVIGDDGMRPSGFCERAWRVIADCVNGGSTGCADVRENVRVMACPDGTRPVIFKVECF